VDVFGTIVLPAMLVLSGAGAFGYAKPVPVNVGRLRNPRNHGLLVSLVGPTVNITLAVLSAFVLRLLLPRDLLLLRFGGRPSLLGELIFDLGLVNVVLATFNLLPIPPLDGSALLERVLPSRYWPTYLRFRQYSMGLVLVVVLLLPGALSRVFDPAFNLWRRLL
jgi:Zn-dependent protease